MSFNTQVIELLGEKTMSTNDIHRALGMSINYVRTQLRLMENAGLIERQDNRVPVIYKLSPNNPAVQFADRIKQTKKKLMLPVEDNDVAMMRLIKSVPKSEWPMLADSLTVYAESIKELVADGLAVDIL